MPRQPGFCSNSTTVPASIFLMTMRSIVIHNKESVKERCFLTSKKHVRAKHPCQVSSVSTTSF